ncbi:MAG: hypothetical protein LBK42_03795 [Propionibacteriaceae bacterium]|nr:hypothetical protein [Propionibacteriaceae bacterium]
MGNTASGKSHLAKAISQTLSLPLHHLDQLYWHSDWTHASRHEFLQTQLKLIAAECWVIDGCFAEFGLDKRFQAADLVVFLDLSTVSCVRRASSRRGHQHDGLPAGADDAGMGLGRTLAFLAEMLLFPLVDRPRVLRAARRSGVALKRLRSWDEETGLIDELGKRRETHPRAQDKI